MPPGVDIHTAGPGELKQCQVLETQLMQNLANSWDLPVAGSRCGPQYSFSWLLVMPVDPQIGLTLSIDGRGDLLREPE